jgi:tetratricopeptide (TPR) repeat protein
MSIPDLIANLEKAAANFEASIRLQDDFADGYAAAAGVNGWLGAFDMRNNPAETPKRIKKFWRLLTRATELEPDNPRVLWVKAVPLLVLPPDKGGNLDGAIALYRRMDELSKAESDPASPLPDWGKPEALMSLAFAHLQQSDLAAAGEEARAALRLQPEWSYVRDVLVPQIEAAHGKQAGAAPR